MAGAERRDLLYSEGGGEFHIRRSSFSKTSCLSLVGSSIRFSRCSVPNSADFAGIQLHHVCVIPDQGWGQEYEQVELLDLPALEAEEPT